jgi:hypothetical protein
VLHCGDFGFYSEARLEELPDRELALRIRHSEKLRHLKNKAFSMSRPEKIGSATTAHTTAHIAHAHTAHARTDGGCQRW